MRSRGSVESANTRVAAPEGSIRVSATRSASALARAAAASAPLLTWRSRFARIALMASSSAGRDTSMSAVSQSCCANTWAMPRPIVPAPTTATRLTACGPPKRQRAPSQARAQGWGGGLQDQHGDGEFPEIAEEEGERAQSRGEPRAPGEQHALSPAPQVDEQEAGERRERHPAGAPAVTHQPADREARDRLR